MEDFMNRATIKVIGVGGAGGNAINDMIESGISGVDFVAANTDSQDLEISKASHKIHLGERATKGLGAGADPERAREAAEEAKEKIRHILEGTDMLFITAGMGGGTGTGAAPIIAELAKEIGILTVGIVTKPFSFEGPQRKKNAETGIENLRKHVDTLIAIPNDKLFELPNMNITLMNAFKEANNILRAGVKGISELITKQGYINLDFADIRAIMKDSGVAMLGFGEADGENRAIIATEQALNSPLLEKSIEGSRKILLNITGGLDLQLTEIQEISNTIIEKAGSGTANLIFGTVIDEETNGIKVSIVATDFIDKRTSNIGLMFGNESSTGSTTSIQESGKLIDSTSQDDGFVVPPFFNEHD
jgi:cell division protein FtsZ